MRPSGELKYLKNEILQVVDSVSIYLFTEMNALEVRLAGFVDPGFKYLVVVVLQNKTTTEIVSKLPPGAKKANC